MSCRGWSSDAYWAGLVARELSARGHAVSFVARAGTEAKVLDRLRALGVGRLETTAFAGRRAPGAAWGDLRRIGGWLAEHDVVHVHRGREHWLAAVARLAGRRTIPLVRTRHIVHPVGTHAANRWLYRQATARVIAVSERIRQQYLDSGLLGGGRVITLAGGVDAAVFHPGVDGSAFRRRHGIGAGERVVGVLAGLRAMKGHGVFLEAARRLRGDDVRFVVVGGGRHDAEVRATIERLGLGRRVVLAGFEAAPEQAVAAFDVAVSPSLSSEGMGRVVFEYMAAGRGLVATTVGLAAEVLRDGETALLVPPGDADALSAAIARLLEARELAARIGAACRRLVETRYAAAVVAGSVERVYRESLAAA